MASKARIESNKWLRENCKDIKGKVLSIGSLDDSDGEGNFYKNYFQKASEYLTSEIDTGGDCDLILDVTNMKDIGDESFDCVFCCGVLEHVYEFKKGLEEISRILSQGGVLILGLPFNQSIHMEEDYWRFTSIAIKRMLKKDFEIRNIEEVGKSCDTKFPATYLVKALKK